TATGTPPSGPGSAPSATISSTRRAWAIAPSTSTTVQAPRCPSVAAIASNVRPTTSAADLRPVRAASAITTRSLTDPSLRTDRIRPRPRQTLPDGSRRSRGRWWRDSHLPLGGGHMLQPVLGEIGTAADPDVVEAPDVFQEATECRDSARAADDAGVQPNREH